MMFPMPTFMPVSDADIDVAHVGGKLSASASTQHTLTDVALGAPDATRKIVAMVYFTTWRGGFSITSATIGGVAAAISVQQPGTTAGGGNYFGVAVLIAVVPNGTTGTIVVNFNGVLDNVWVLTIRAVHLASSAPHDTAKASAYTPASQMISLDLPSGGFVCAPAFAYSQLGINLSGITQFASTAIISGYHRAVGGLTFPTSVDANHSVTLTRTQGDGLYMSGSMCAASYR